LTSSTPISSWAATGQWPGSDGCSDKTVKRVLERRDAASSVPCVGRGHSRPTRVRATDGLISAKRLLPLARAAGGAAPPSRCSVGDAAAGRPSWGPVTVFEVGVSALF
jgi:hypothetical protein